MRKAAFLLLLCLVLPLCGCHDAVDLSEQIFAVNLALDTGQGDALRLTVQYPQIVPTGRQPAQTDSDLQKNGYVIHRTEGKDLTACLEALQMITPRRVSLLQLRGVYLSESLVTDALLPDEVLPVLSDAHTVCPTALVHITRRRAEDILLRQLPLFGARLSKSQAAQNRALMKLGVIPSAPLDRFCADLNTPGRSAIAALTAINNMQYTDSPSPGGLQPTSCLAGEIPRSTADSVDLCGSALLSDGKILFLDGYETQLLNLLTGHLRALTLFSNGRYAHLTVRRTPDLSVDLRGDAPCLKVRLPVRCEEDDSALFTEQLVQDVLSLLLKLQQHGMDPAGFGDRARMHALTLEDWAQTDWLRIYPTARIEVSLC